MEDPRLCVVGAGHHATRRIYPYLGAAGAQLAGVCDLDREKAERNARRFGGTPYDALEPMLEAEQPDGVMVCIGPSAHGELAPIVMRRGIPVYTEKPPAATAALAVARVSQETGVLCTTAFKKRYATAIAQRAPGGRGSGLAHRLYSLYSTNCARGRITEGTARNERQGRASGASLPPLPAPATAAATPAT